MTAGIPFAAIGEPVIAFETEEYLGVFKPAGTHSVPSASGGTAPLDLVSWLRRELPERGSRIESSSDGGGPLAHRMRDELGMLSRLDVDTSGLILFARSEEVFLKCVEAQKRGQMRKFYRLVVARSASGELSGSRPLRCPAPGIGPLLDFPAGLSGPLTIESYFRSYGEKRARVACVASEFRNDEKKPLSPERYATTICCRGKSMVEEFSDMVPAVDVEAMIPSGFRHQIRAHLAWAGYPVVGDKLYGGIAASRLHLESHRIEIALPGRDALLFELYDPERPSGEFLWR
ncbi:MAG TPA: RNA pseudouridine synthase [Rectinemataceae bacterium]|nr:RNA pseudouridine synthase [Rectinemataceae bacterium]